MHSRVRFDIDRCGSSWQGGLLNNFMPSDCTDFMRGKKQSLINFFTESKISNIRHSLIRKSVKSVVKMAVFHHSLFRYRIKRCLKPSHVPLHRVLSMCHLVNRLTKNGQCSREPGAASADLRLRSCGGLGGFFPRSR